MVFFLSFFIFATSWVFPLGFSSGNTLPRALEVKMLADRLADFKIQPLGGGWSRKGLGLGGKLEIFKFWVLLLICSNVLVF